MDASLIADEVIDSILRKKDTRVLCKFDIEKAYDEVDWNFLVMVMRRMGFDGKWVGWIKWCISTSSFLVLLNGNPIGFLTVPKVLDKGTPFPPICLFLGWRCSPL